MKQPSKSFNSGSPPPQPSNVWMRSANKPSKQSKRKISEMHRVERLNTPSADNLAAAEKVADKVADTEMAGRSTNGYHATSTIISLKGAERDSIPNTTQTTVR